MKKAILNSQISFLISSIISYFLFGFDLMTVITIHISLSIGYIFGLFGA